MIRCNKGYSTVKSSTYLSTFIDVIRSTSTIKLEQTLTNNGNSGVIKFSADIQKII